MKIFVFLTFVAAINFESASSQGTCPDGALAVAECNKATRICESDTSLQCNKLGSYYYCCASSNTPSNEQPKEPSKEDPNCYDAHPNCASIESLCHSILLSGILQQKCAKTCGYCGSSNPASPMKFPWEYNMPICPSNGFMSFSKCNQTTKHCDTDPSMECSEIGGTQWCCDPPAEDPDCHDVHSHCRKFEHLCSSVLLDDTMRDICPKTCGFCTPKTKPKDKPNDDKCADNNDNCGELEDLCHSGGISDVVKFDCKKTCGFCGKDIKQKEPECIDTNQNCLKLIDLCKDESLFTQDLMKTQCKHSCGFCKRNDDDTSEHPKTSDSDCVDLNANCEKVADICDNNNVELRNLMKLQCKKTCGHCGNDKKKTPTPIKQQPNKEDCVDTSPHCIRIKEMCESSRGIREGYSSKTNN